jgi:hypothetical protein
VPSFRITKEEPLTELLPTSLEFPVDGLPRFLNRPRKKSRLLKILLHSFICSKDALAEETSLEKGKI